MTGKRFLLSSSFRGSPYTRRAVFQEIASDCIIARRIYKQQQQQQQFRLDTTRRRRTSSQRNAVYDTVRHYAMRRDACTEINYENCSVTWVAFRRCRILFRKTRCNVCILTESDFQSGRLAIDTSAITSFSPNLDECHPLGNWFPN